jgi:tripartite ATP-independent transporter DctM subunit
MLLLMASISIILILLEMPITFSILGASIAFIGFDPNINFSIIPNMIIQGIDSFVLIAVPLFVLVGVIMSQGGITIRLMNIAVSLVGHLPGGLGHVNVVASMIFSGMSGTTTSDVAGIGRVEIPMMTKAGYRASTAAVITAVSACIGPIIPPSVPFILYGALTDTSVGRLFVGGAVPGVLLGLSLMGVVAYSAKTGKFGGVGASSKRASLKEILHAFREGFWAIITPVVIMAGIIFGLFTPTEAAGITVFYSLFITIFVYKELKVKDIFKILCDSAELIGVIMVVVASAAVFGWILTQAGIADIMSDFMFGVTESPMGILILINIIMLFLGCFVEATSMIILLSPILMPIIQKINVDPVHFGIIFTLNIMIAVITPPVGLCAYIASDIAGITMQEFSKEAIPYIVAMILFLVVIIFFPSITTFLPNLVFGK